MLELHQFLSHSLDGYLMEGSSLFYFAIINSQHQLALLRAQQLFNKGIFLTTSVASYIPTQLSFPHEVRDTLMLLHALKGPGVSGEFHLLFGSVLRTRIMTAQWTERRRNAVFIRRCVSYLPYIFGHTVEICPHPGELHSQKVWYSLKSMRVPRGVHLGNENICLS